MDQKLAITNRDIGTKIKTTVDHRVLEIKI
jgi:hypothetical protein